MRSMHELSFVFGLAGVLGAASCGSVPLTPDGGMTGGGGSTTGSGGSTAGAAGSSTQDPLSRDGSADVGGSHDGPADGGGGCDACDTGAGNAATFFLLDPVPAHVLTRPGDDPTRVERRTNVVAASADGSTFIGFSRITLHGPGDEIPQPPTTGGAVFRWTEGTGVVSLASPSFLQLADPRQSGCDAFAASADAAVVFGDCAGAAGLSPISYRWSAATGFESVGIAAKASSWSLQAITPDGAVLIGDYFASPPALSGVFRWSEQTGLVTLDSPPGAVETIAYGVTASGDVVFGRSSDSNDRTDAFRWSSATGTVTLPRLPNAVSCWVVSTPPADGTTNAGACSRMDGSNDAYRWTASAGTVALGAPPGYSSTRAWRISRDGSVIVGNTWGTGPQTSDGNGVPPPGVFRWTEASGSVLIAPASFLSQMSDDGSVVAGAATTSPLSTLAFRWSQSSGLVNLHPLDSDANSTVTSMSRDGATMTGTSDNNAFPGHAVIWDADGKAHLLADVLQAAGADLRGTILTEAVSPDGRLFWGQGTIPSGERRGWVARLPR